MKNTKRRWAFALAALAILVSLAACSDNGELEPTGPSKPVTDPDVAKKLNKNGKRVVQEAWGEPEEDPRQLIGYQLEDGTPFFDRYVILYGGRVVYRDCSMDDNTLCQKTGLHLHYGDDEQRLLYDDYQNKLRPLQEAGIMVLMSLVPGTDGVGVGSLYEWPNEEYWPWEANNATPYPFGEAETQAFVREVAAELVKYQLDGVAYDEEYANKAGTSGPGFPNVYPDLSVYQSFGATNEKINNAWAKGGKNLFRFAYELQQAMPYPIVQDVYEIRFGARLPESMTFDGKRVRITDVFDYTFEPNYGDWRSDPANPMPKNRYGPCSIALADVDTAPLPPANANGIDIKMVDHLAGDYGMVMYYCFRSRNEIAARWPNKYGEGHPEPEYYLSRISRELYGQSVTYVGRDYPRMRGPWSGL